MEFPNISAAVMPTFALKAEFSILALVFHVHIVLPPEIAGQLGNSVPKFRLDKSASTLLISISFPLISTLKMILTVWGVKYCISFPLMSL